MNRTAAFVAPSVAGFVLLIVSGATAPAAAANFGAHVGLSEDANGTRYFVAGALLADLDHFLPATEPATDTPAFTAGMIERAWGGSAGAWDFVRGWAEHLDQDARFAAAVLEIQSAYPSYTTTDVRLAFDYLTLTKHPISTGVGFVLDETEIHGLIAGGLLATDSAGVRDAIDRLLYSTDPAAPGYLLQLDAARVYGVLYPQVVRDVEPYYDAFYAGSVAGWWDPFPPIHRLLYRMERLFRGLPASLRAQLYDFYFALDVARTRPPGWIAQEQALLWELSELAGRLAGGSEFARALGLFADLAAQGAEMIEPPG